VKRRRASAPAAIANINMAGPGPFSSPPPPGDTDAPTKKKTKADARRHLPFWPPENQKQPPNAGQPTHGPEAKTHPPTPYDLMNYADYTRVATYLPEAGKRYHRGEQEGNEQMCSIHLR